jgi:hypothetical protein
MPRDLFEEAGIDPRAETPAKAPRDLFQEAGINMLVPNEPPPEKDFIDKINYIGDAASKGLRHGISAPAQFINPFLDAVFGSNLTGSLNELNKTQDENYYNKHPDAGIGAETVSNLAELFAPLGVGAKAFSIPKAGAQGLAKLAELGASGALSGAASAPFVYDETGNVSPLEKTAASSLAGGILSPLAHGLAYPFKSSFNYLFSPSKDAYGDMLKGVLSYEAKPRLEAGRRLGINLTPAEAGDSNMAAVAQGKAGITEEGAEKVYQYGKERTQQEKIAINNLLDDISKDKGIASGSIRNISKEIIGEKEKALSKKASPLYDKAIYLDKYEKALIDPENPVLDKGRILRTVSPEIFDTLSKDPIISDAIEKIIKKPVYQKDLNNVPPYTVKYLDYVKRYIDDLNRVAVKKGENNESRLLTIAKNDLVSAIDEVNPDYKKARAIYSEEAKPLNELKESNVGIIADLKNKNLKEVSQKIFDPTQTDLETFKKMASEYQEKSPETWNKIIRNEMERRMSKVDGNYGSNFYKKVLVDENGFSQFLEATKEMPKVQQKLQDMKMVFRTLINQENVKGAYGKSKTSMYSFRNFGDFVRKQIEGLRGGLYDKAAVNLITSGKWDKELEKINRIKNKDIRAEKTLNLLDVIEGSVPVVTAKQYSLFSDR